MKRIRLVSPENKFYEMRQLDEFTFLSTLGKIGGNDVIRIEHSIDKWDKILTDKQQRGFEEDLSRDLFSEHDEPNVTSDSSIDTKQDHFTAQDLANLNVADYIAEKQKIFMEENGLL